MIISQNVLIWGVSSRGLLRNPVVFEFCVHHHFVVMDETHTHRLCCLSASFLFLLSLADLAGSNGEPLGDDRNLYPYT